jgi:hypothetical protein
VTPRRPAIRLAKPLRDAIAAGHPWLYDRALGPLPAGLGPGDLAVVADDRGPLVSVFPLPPLPPPPPPARWRPCSSIPARRSARGSSIAIPAR